MVCMNTRTDKPADNTSHHNTRSDTAETRAAWVARALQHPHALWILCFISFIEASVFPIPPYALLVPMCAEAPNKAIRIALIASAASVAGGLVGYGIGYLAADLANDMVNRWGYAQAFANTKDFVAQWGALSILLSTLTPLPYKVMTITAGLFSMNLPLFIVSSMLARSLRFVFAAVVAGRLADWVVRRRAAKAARMV